MIPDASIQFIIDQETGGQAYYDKFASRPTWPGGASGVTIGVGYDLGQATDAMFRQLWGGMIDAATLDRLAAAVGVRGSAAGGADRCKALVASLTDVHIPFQDAKQVFTQAILPRYEAQTLAAFPGLDKLDGLCIGAMVSLVYNRGPSLVGDSRTEMKTIHDLIAAGTPAGVPDQFRAMKRLWPNSTGLRNRRDAEAAMFQQGLDAMATAAAATPVA